MGRRIIEAIAWMLIGAFITYVAMVQYLQHH
jgi:hypothetical protein